MKRISLLALSASAVMAQAPAAAPAAAAVDATAPLAPIHDELIYGNPALPGSLGYLMITPSDYFGKREAAFQWDGSSASTFNGTGLAVVDQYFAGFSSNGDQGQLGAGYITPGFGVGLRFNLDKQSYSDDNPANGEVVESDSTLEPTSVGVFGSMPLSGNTLYAFLDWGTPVTNRSVTRQTATGKFTTANRSDSYTVGVGALSPANGDNGISWRASLELSNIYRRDAGVSDADAESRYGIVQTASVGKTFSKSGFILAAGFNEGLMYGNGKNNPDWEYSISLQPTIATILPIFERWSVKGGTGLSFLYDSRDTEVGKDEKNSKRLWTAEPDARVGIRYERGRWAAEAQVVNGFLSRGPNFVSGAAGNLFTSFAVTANFK